MPALIADAGEQASWCYIEFFTANIRNGSVANPGSGRSDRRSPKISGGNSEQACNEGGLRLHVAGTNIINLPLSNHRHHFIAGQCPSGRGQAAEVQPRPHQSFDPAMILLDDVVQVFALPQPREAPQLASSLHVRDRTWIGRVLVHRDRAWGYGVRLGQRLAEEPLRRSRVPPDRQQEIDRLAQAVDCPIEVGPDALDLDVGRILSANSGGRLPLVWRCPMSLHPEPIGKTPVETARVARAAFSKGAVVTRLRGEFSALFKDEDFRALYPARGQPGLAPWRLALVTVFQFLEHLSDRQAADAVRARIDWKYALGLELTDPGFHFSVLTEFRACLVAGGAEHLLLDRMLERFQARGLVKARGKQRTDSTRVLAAVHDLHLLELVGETLRAALDDVASAAPDARAGRRARPAPA